MKGLDADAFRRLLLKRPKGRLILFESSWNSFSHPCFLFCSSFLKALAEVISVNLHIVVLEYSTSR